MWKRSSSSKRHKCPKRQCVCAQVSELTDLLQELRCLRKKAKKAQRKSHARTVEFRMSDSQVELYENDCDLRNAILKVMQEQRDEVEAVLEKVNQVDRKLDGEQESICRDDRQLAELESEICALKEQFGCCGSARKVHHRIDRDEIEWRKVLATEVEQRGCLQQKMKRMMDWLERLRSKDNAVVEERREQRRLDARILLSAVDIVEKCVSDAGRLHQSLVAE